MIFIPAFGFPIINFPWLSVDVPRLSSYGIYISQSIRYARRCTSVLDFYSKSPQITSKLLSQGYRYHKICKTFLEIFQILLWALFKIWCYTVQVYLTKEISHLVFYGYLVY